MSKKSLHFNGFSFWTLAPDGRCCGRQWHSSGQRFDPAYPHQDLKSSDFRPFSYYKPHGRESFSLPRGISLLQRLVCDLTLADNVGGAGQIQIRHLISLPFHVHHQLSAGHIHSHLMAGDLPQQGQHRHH